jgi:hypothetical protein
MEKSQCIATSLQLWRFDQRSGFHIWKDIASSPDSNLLFVPTVRHQPHHLWQSGRKDFRDTPSTFKMAILIYYIEGPEGSFHPVLHKSWEMKAENRKPGIFEIWLGLP